MGKLIVVPTPIGNLQDITARSIEVLSNCDMIYAEDTRVTRKLLSHLGISKPLKSFHIHNEHKKLNTFLKEIEFYSNTVLVSDAGTPGISDPGFLLIRACIEKGINIETLPGPTAIIPALVGSGFPCDTFIFEGFLPHKKGRKTKLENLSEERRTIVLFESPYRLKKLLDQMTEFFSENRQICVVRELTKIHETFHRGTLQELKSEFADVEPRGEIVIVVKGKEK